MPSQVPGAMLEDNKYALSVHTRNVSAADLPRLDELVQGVLEEQPLLRRSEGKHVIELKPQVSTACACACACAYSMCMCMPEA